MTKAQRRKAWEKVYLWLDKQKTICVLDEAIWATVSDSIDARRMRSELDIFKPFGKNGFLFSIDNDWKEERLTAIALLIAFNS
jgi:hypothetical protein